MITPRILYDNYAAAAATVQSASSEDVGFELIKLPDQARARRWRTKTGWTIVPGFNDEFPFWTTTDGFRIAHIVPGTYATAAAEAAALQTAMGIAGANPIGIGASLWLRADSVTVVNGLVSQMNDISGNGRHAAQAAAGLQGTFVANAVDGRPGVYFPGDVARGYSTSALMSTMLAATTGRSTIVWVFKLDSDASANDTFWWAGSAGHFMSALWSGGTGFGAQVFTTGDVTATKTASLGVNAWQHGWFEYDGSNVQSYISNANSAAAQNAAQTGNVHADVLNSVFNIGQSAIFKGYLLELMIFPGTLSEPQRRQLTQYIKGRYPSVAANDTTTAPTWTDTNSVAYSSTTKKFSFSTTAAQLKLLGATTTPAASITASGYKDHGLTLVDKTGAATYTADNAAYQSRGYIKIDFGSALAITSTVALDHNAGSGGTFTLEGNDIDLWLSPAVSQSLTGDTVQRSAYFASSARRYRRLTIEDVQNTAGYSELGILFLGPYLQPPYPYSDRYKPGSNALSLRTYGSFGSLHLDTRPRQRKWDLEFDTMDQATVDLFEAMETVTPPGRAFFFLFDSAAPTGIRYVELQGPIEYQPVPPYYFTVAMPIQEVLP